VSQLLLIVQQRGPWLWGVVLVGALLRAWFVFGTAGTLDVVVWEGHAWEINQKGLIAYYHGGQYIFNHPPLMGEIFSRLYSLAAITNIPFAVFLRLPFAVLDFGTAWLLLRLMGPSRWRYAIFAAYWLSPLAILFSAYHGNTDSALALALVAAVLFVSRGQAVLAGAAIGLGLWVKFPAILALPALALALPGWRARASLVGTALCVGIASYVPALLADWEVVVRSVFFYPGLQVQSPAGVRVWGTQLFYPDPEALPAEWRQDFMQWVRNVYRANTAIVVVPILFVAWARRNRTTPLEIAANVGASYAIFHGLTNFWAFQYLAWALPLWLVSGWRFGASSLLVSTAYVYVLYIWLCGDPMLAGEWNWMGKPHWPTGVLWLRNIAVLYFLAVACALIWGAARDETRRLRRRIGEPSEPGEGRA
jgi:hypothetical protein